MTILVLIFIKYAYNLAFISNEKQFPDPDTELGFVYPGLFETAASQIYALCNIHADIFYPLLLFDVLCPPRKYAPPFWTV